MPGNKKPRKKTAKRSPSFGSFTKGDLLLSKDAQKSFKAFEEGKAAPLDWFVICRRMMICIELVQVYYKEQSVREMQECLDVVTRANARSEHTGTLMFTPEELEYVRAGLEAADTVEQQTTIQQQQRAYAKIHLELGLIT